MKGYKTCPSCKANVGARTLNCKCGFNFSSSTQSTAPKPVAKRRRKKVKKYNFCTNWRELETGTVIKVLQGSGPYHIINDQTYNLGYWGIFTVIRQDKDGVIARKNDNSGVYFIYLSEEVKTGITGSTLAPHKILIKNNLRSHDSSQ